jgi:hypothetical protein
MSSTKSSHVGCKSAISYVRIRTHAPIKHEHMKLKLVKLYHDSVDSTSTSCGDPKTALTSLNRGDIEHHQLCITTRPTVGEKASNSVSTNFGFCTTSPTRISSPTAVLAIAVSLCIVVNDWMASASQMLCIRRGRSHGWPLMLSTLRLTMPGGGPSQPIGVEVDTDDAPLSSA